MSASTRGAYNRSHLSGLVHQESWLKSAWFIERVERSYLKGAVGRTLFTAGLGVSSCDLAIFLKDLFVLDKLTIKPFFAYPLTSIPSSSIFSRDPAQFLFHTLARGCYKLVEVKYSPNRIKIQSRRDPAFMPVNIFLSTRFCSTKRSTEETGVGSALDQVSLTVIRSSCARGQTSHRPNCAMAYLPGTHLILRQRT